MEMANVRVAFELLKGVISDHMREVKLKSGFKYFGIHMVLDIKMDGNFTRKAIIVSVRH